MLLGITGKVLPSASPSRVRRKRAERVLRPLAYCLWAVKASGTVPGQTVLTFEEKRHAYA